MGPVLAAQRSVIGSEDGSLVVDESYRCGRVCGYTEGCCGVIVKREDLSPEDRRVFDTWRDLGLSEQATVGVMREDGLIAMSDHDHLVVNFKSLGLSESAAEIAAQGRDGPSRRHIGASPSAASIAERAVESRALVNTVRELAGTALRRVMCGHPR